jgi:hypothetical protein
MVHEEEKLVPLLLRGVPFEMEGVAGARVGLTSWSLCLEG